MNTTSTSIASIRSSSPLRVPAPPVAGTAPSPTRCLMAQLDDLPVRSASPCSFGSPRGSPYSSPRASPRSSLIPEPLAMRPRCNSAPSSPRQSLESIAESEEEEEEADEALKREVRVAAANAALTSARAKQRLSASGGGAGGLGVVAGASSASLPESATASCVGSMSSLLVGQDAHVAAPQTSGLSPVPMICVNLASDGGGSIEEPSSFRPRSQSVSPLCGGPGKRTKPTHSPLSHVHTIS